MPVHISHPTCCPPTLMPTLSAHPLRAPATTLYMPPPPAHCPLHPAATALSIPPLPPSLSRCHCPLHPAATALSIQPPPPGGCAFIWSCTCTVGFVTHHGGRPGWWRVKDDDSGDEFGVCSVQPIPRPIVCTAPSRATAPPPPSTCRCCPLHAATAALSVPPLLPLCAIASLTTGRCLYVRCHPCPWPSCTCHMQPGPLGAHIAVTRVSPASTPLTQAHAPPLCAPRVLAPSLAPSAAVPRISAPIVCTLASQAPSAAVPHVSAPVACALTSWAPSVAMRRDHMTVFVLRSCATGWHTRIGRVWETVHTL